MKLVYAPHLGRSVKLGGRRRPRTPGLCLKLENYITNRLAAPPSTVDYSPAAMTALRQMYDNDTLGDCVIAGGYHTVGVETGNATAGTPFIATNDQIIADYSAIGGYVPGDESTDQGCDMQTALNYWSSHGSADGTKDLGWLAVDPTNVTLVKQALWLFGNLDFGIELPDAWISPFPSADGFTWDVAGAPDPDNGHCIVGVAYDSVGVTIATWALLGKLTFAAITEYCASSANGELYVRLTPDQVAKGQAIAPNGVAWADLISDWNSIGGHVSPAPAPAPSPSPSPTPTPPTPAPPVQDVTLSIATNAVKSAFASGPWCMWPSTAERIAVNALTNLKGWPSS